MIKRLLLLSFSLVIVAAPQPASSLTVVNSVHFKNATANCISVKPRGGLQGKWEDFESKEIAANRQATFDFRPTLSTWFPVSHVTLQVTVHSTSSCSSSVLATLSPYLTNIDGDRLKLVGTETFRVEHD